MSIIIENTIISYPAIFEPKENLSGVLKYSCSLLIDKNDTKVVERVKKAIDAAIKTGIATKWGGKQPKFRYEPLRDGDAELESGEKTDAAYKGKYFVNLSSDKMPGIVGPNGQPLLDQNKLYAGCIVHVEANPFAYSNGGNSGIGWGLENVMLVGDGERLDGRQSAESAFAGYAQDEQ